MDLGAARVGPLLMICHPLLKILGLHLDFRRLGVGEDGVGAAANVALLGAGEGGVGAAADVVLQVVVHGVLLLLHLDGRIFTGQQPIFEAFTKPFENLQGIF